MGLPEMAAYWAAMKASGSDGTITHEESEEFDRLKKALRFVRSNPRRWSSVLGLRTWTGEKSPAKAPPRRSESC